MHHVADGRAQQIDDLFLDDRQLVEVPVLGPGQEDVGQAAQAERPREALKLAVREDVGGRRGRNLGCARSTVSQRATREAEGSKESVQARSAKRSLSDCMSAWTSGRQSTLALGGALKKRLSEKASETSERHALSVCGFLVISCSRAKMAGSASKVLLEGKRPLQRSSARQPRRHGLACCAS